MSRMTNLNEPEDMEITVPTCLTLNKKSIKSQVDEIMNVDDSFGKSEVEEIPIDYLIHDILILKAECLRDQKLLGYCEYLEKQLFKVKNGEAKIKV